MTKQTDVLIVGGGFGSARVAQLPIGITTMNLIVNLKQKDLGISEMYKGYGTQPDKLN